VAANEPSTAPAPAPLRRLRLALVAAVVVLVAVVVALVLLHRGSSNAVPASSNVAATWVSGEKAAPGFRLTDEHGRSVSLAGLRGRRVFVTFVDPHCTTFCPRESIVLNDAIRTLPVAERPAVVAVSVDPKTRSLAVLRQEARRFKWLPQWRWAVGSDAQLRAVWAAYHIEVVPTPGDIAHTEAAYLVDAHGDQRALLLWPFKDADVASALEQLR
jgi:cytochrome oxidase Cu insertion factor (SCO1/SenC/PrrC family)